MIMSIEKQSMTEYRLACIHVWNCFLKKHLFTDEFGCIDGYEPMGEDDSYGGYAMIFVGDFFLSIDDAILDMELNCPEYLFFEWYEYNLDHSLRGYGNVNYRSYIAGFRFRERSRFRDSFYQWRKKTEASIRYNLNIIGRRRFKKFLKEKNINIKDNRK